MNGEVSSLLSNVESLNVAGILDSVKSDLDGDVKLVEKILSEVGVGVNLSAVTGLINSVITTVKILDSTVNGLTANTAVGNLVSEIESDLSTILKGLGSLV